MKMRSFLLVAAITGWAVASPTPCQDKSREQALAWAKKAGGQFQAPDGKLVGLVFTACDVDNDDLKRLHSLTELRSLDL